MFEAGSEASGAGVAIEAKGPRRVDHRVPVWEDENRWRGKFREKDMDSIFHCGGEIERSALLEKGRYRADAASHVGQELAVAAKTAK